MGFTNMDDMLNWLYGDADFPPCQPLAPETLQIRSHTLVNSGITNEDGSVWGETYVVAPGDDPIDVTPTATQVYGCNDYTFQVKAREAKLKILANGIDLSTNTPEFCVGQQVTYQLVFEPPLPAGTQTQLGWVIALDYVNTNTPGQNGASPTYTMDLTQLTNATTKLWYVQGASDTHGWIWCNVTNILPNGDSLVRKVQGQVSVYRPTFSNFKPMANFFAWPVYYYGIPFLQGSMDWSVTLNSKYDGFIGVTQLIKATHGVYDTGGNWYQDGDTEIYGDTSNPTGIYSVANIATHSTTLDDNPRAAPNPCVTMQATFKDYLRFKPGGSNSIWITIGINGWSINGAACLITGMSHDDIPPATPLTSSSDFPVWVSIRPE
jgi:hypothetical protein